jgi:DNA polymerase-3 subunit delta'
MTVWDDLIGQDETVAALQSAAAAAAEIAAGREATSGAMTHAWLFTGPAGSGRSVAARALAAALQCERTPAGCGECTACHTVRTRSHPDVHSVVPEGLSISVAEMRSVVGRSARRPILGRWQVVVIEDADRLTEQASNALLKALEEPPSRTVFLLCVPSLHPDDVSLTIRSRCRLVTLRVPPPEAIAAVLRAEGIPAASLSAELDGGETEALQIALGGGGTGKGTAGTMRGTAGAMRDLEKRQKSRATRTQRDALDRALVDLAAFYRDVLLVQTRSSVPAAHPDFDDDVRTVALRLEPPQVLRRLDAVLTCRQQVELNVKPRIAVEALTAALRLPS